MGNMAPRETLWLGEVLKSLSRVLPETWSLHPESAPSHPLGRRFDALLTVASPSGVASTFVVEVKSSGRLSTALLVNVASQTASQAGLPGVIATDYANPNLRAACLDHGLGYLDTTGWTYLRDDRAGLFVSTQGAPRAPGPPRATAMARLNGPGASQVIQVLFDALLPVGVRDLATASGVSPGTAAKVLPALEQAGVIERGDDGRVIGCDHSGLLTRWTQDYDFARSNKDVEWFLAPRGPEWVLSQLRKMSAHQQVDGPTTRVAATGSVAARGMLPKDTLSVTPLALVPLYSADPGGLAHKLGLRRATKPTANVVLARPRDEVLFDSPSTFDGYLRVAPRARVLADLLTLGGRFVDEADQLLATITSARGLP